MTERPWIVTAIAAFVFFGAALVLGSLWSGSESGRAFAQAATSTYESAWLPWAGGLVAAACAVGIFLGWPWGRWLLLIWMGWGVIEGLFLLDEPHYSVPTLVAYAVLTGALFTPPVNAWFAKDKG